MPRDPRVPGLARPMQALEPAHLFDGNEDPMGNGEPQYSEDERGEDKDTEKASRYRKTLRSQELATKASTSTETWTQLD
eukprot:1070399-Prorocentrum_lima.AAC.1